MRYLAYGSNLHPARLFARIGVVTILGAVRLADESLVFHKRGADGSGKCDLLPCPGGVAWGAVYDIPDEARETLDRIEGLGRGYGAARLEVNGLGECYTYRALHEARDASLVPFDWYHAFVVEGARWHGFPVEYIALLEATTVCADPDVDRAALNRRVLGAER